MLVTLRGCDQIAVSARNQHGCSNFWETILRSAVGKVAAKQRQGSDELPITEVSIGVVYSRYLDPFSRGFTIAWPRY